MCGIFGMLRNNTIGLKSDNFIEQALMQGQIRGADGTGLATIARDLSCSHYASAQPAHEFIADKRSQKIISSIGNSVGVIGHHRATTRGENIDSHCHPFNYGHITGVHNGSIPEPIIAGLVPSSLHPVDSARIYAAIAEAENPVTVLEKLSLGAYALVWYNSDNKTVYMARNKERPLHLLEGNESLLFASELGMLTWLSGRGFLHSKGAKLCQLNEHTLYSFPMENLGEVSAVPYTPDVPMYVPYSYNENYHTGRNWITGTTGNSWVRDDWDDDYFSTEFARRQQRSLPFLADDAKKYPTFIPSQPAVTYQSLIEARNAWPSIVYEADLMRDSMALVRESQVPVVEFVPLINTKNIRGETGFAGCLVDRGTNIVQYDAPVFMPYYNAGYTMVTQAMEGGPPSKKGLTPNLSVPVMSGKVRSFYVTCDGQLTMVVEGIGQRPNVSWLNQLNTKKMRQVAAKIEKYKLTGEYAAMRGTWESHWKALIAANDAIV